MNRSSKLIRRILIWRIKHINHRQFILILSLIIGILSGLAAVVLKNAIHFMHKILTEGFSIDTKNFLYLVYPIVGILITVLFVKYVVKDNLGHGVSKILYAISKLGGKLKPHNNYSSIIASTFTIGFGGSVGAEAPIVLTGASLGSTLGRMFHLNYKTIILLIGCGASGAIAGIFKAPIAGIVFTLEILMLDLTMASLVPLLISAVSAATIAYFFLGKGVEFTFQLNAPFVLNEIPFYIFLGIVGGVISLYFTRVVMGVEGWFAKFSNVYVKWIIGGVALSFMIFLLPPLWGEGYDTIIALLDKNTDAVVQESMFYGFHNNLWAIFIFLVSLVALKAFATAVTTASGGVGGIFAPSLFVGGVLGYAFALFVNITGLYTLPEANFTLVGMAAVMSGVMHAPLTAIFLIAEITHGYGLFIPLMITSTIAYLTIMYFEPHSIYTKRLARRGELITHHKDKAVLTLMKLNKVIETDFSPVRPNTTLGELVKIIAKSTRNIFPVVDVNNNLLGIVTLNDIREIMFNSNLYNETTVEDLMTLPPAFINHDDTMDVVMQKFEKTGAWNLPVVKDGKYLGFVSKSKIFSVYRRVLVHFSDE
ncbi:MAG: chloride channel protein [Chlorobi bacterium]|nr:chloride channel protein [Chlorobiota bacterium]